MSDNMNHEVQARFARERREKRRRNLWAILACVVVLATVSALVLPAITMEKQPICGLEEHTHGPECYREEKVLICGYPELIESEEIIPEETAQPLLGETQAPAEAAISPAPAETEAPAEAVPAAEPAEALLAEMDSVPTETGPVPTETEPAPTETEPVPTETEPAPTETEPVPTETEPAPTETEPVPTETEPAPTETPHVHTEACYEIRKVLICTIPEHTHTDDCYEKPDPYADTETPADWEAGFADLSLSGSWDQDVLALAATQLGYQESTRNFTWSQAGEKMGYSRYGQWYGDPYGDWCAMFVSFCLHYGGVPRDFVPPQSNCPTWLSQLTQLGLMGQAGEFPAPGDILFIDYDTDGSADHVALVESTSAEDAGTLVHTIEGNQADQVCRMEYALGSPSLLGFCSLSKAQERLAGSPEQQEYTLTYEDTRLSATLRIRGLDRYLSSDAALAVRELTSENAPEAYAQAVARGEEALPQDHQMSGFGLFDFAIFCCGRQIPVPDTAQVSVNVSFKEPLFTPEAVKESAQLQTIVLDGLDPSLPSEAAVPQASQVSPMALMSPAPAETPQPLGTFAGVPQGVTDVSYETTGLSPFAVMLSNHTQQGKFWKVCRNINSGEEFKSGAPYLIVSVEGGYALTNNNGNTNITNKTPIQLQPVKGNPDYYTADNIPQKAIFTYEFNAFSSILGGPMRAMKNSSYYLSPNYTAKLFVGRRNVGELNFVQSNCPACFNLAVGSYYLNFNGDSGKFLGSTSQRLFSGQRDYPYAKTSDMLILQQVDATLTIPDDALDSSGGTGQIGTGRKPGYGAYVSTSMQETGSYEDPVGKVDYFSDPSTSKLEQLFGQKGNNQDFNAVKGDNGKAMMDKSVIYGHDDYSAFSKYENGDFSVTLSALGQAFVVDQSVTKVPMDVLLILDMSNSMNETDAGQAKCRAKVLVDSVNKTMNNIMKAHPENRVCAVGYNSGAYDLLALGHHWKGEGGQYFKYTVGANNEFGHPRISIQATGLSGALGPKVPCEAGTYTQMGIAEGYDLLMRNTPKPEDTTYTTTVNGQTITRPRKPVIILVSDGEPTHCTSHYMDVLRNPYYGDGLGPVSNGKGVQGYYTILSANYYKRMVGIHYNNPAAMYTVAFGMKEEDYQQLGDSAATNHYRATVMNPTQDNIAKLLNANTKYSDQVEKPLYQMLQGTHDGTPQKVGGVWNLIKNMGDTHSYVPILKNNPYRGNYAYADKAYLNNSGNEGLDAAFDEIIKLSTVYDFSYETQANKPLTLYDPIGDGMEVKGDPVLRLNGVNYTHTGKQAQGSATVYTYSGVVRMDPYTDRTVDLSTIQVKVDSAGGKQSVSMSIPPKSLPTYTADPTLSFYHEALPLRLIYQVGLSPAGQAQIDALQPGEVKTFYTNRYQDDHARGTLEPSAKNPYYKNTGWQLSSAKVQNTTQTAGTSLVKSGNAQKVDYALGNNGKLVITKKAPPTPPVGPVSVQKFWESYNGDPMTENLPAEVHLKLYRTYVDASGQTVKETVIDDFVLNAENGWKRTFTPEELSAVPGRQYLYYVEELTKLPDFQVSYEGDGVLANTPENPIKVHNRYRYSDVVLPQTGGPGTFLFTAGGLGLMLAALLMYRFVLRPKRKERRK